MTVSYTHLDVYKRQPVDCGNGHYFAILVGGDTLEERNVILNRGSDYAYTFNPMAYPCLLYTSRCV